MSILAPYYLAAGFTKLRYEGWVSVLKGSWMQYGFRSVAFFPGFNAWAARTPLVCALFSWGCMLVEFVGPLLVLSLDVAESISKFARWSLITWSCLVLCFLIGVYVFLAPNFVRQILLASMALYGVCTSERRLCSAGTGQNVLAVYHCRVVLAMVVLSLWLAVQVSRLFSGERFGFWAPLILP